LLIMSPKLVLLSQKVAVDGVANHLMETIPTRT
jgi:hypothetical protein